MKKLIGEYDTLEEAELEALKSLAKDGHEEITIERTKTDEKGNKITESETYTNLQNLLH